MIPLSDIQRTSVRGTALCLAVSAADLDGVCLQGKQGKPESLSLSYFYSMKEQIGKHTKFTTTYLAGSRNTHCMFLKNPSQILYLAYHLHKVE